MYKEDVYILAYERIKSKPGNTHAMRNELVEELIIGEEATVIQNWIGECVRDSRSGGMESKKGRREEKIRPSREKRPEGFTRRSQLVRKEGVYQRRNAKLRCRETERGGNVRGDAEHLDRDLPSSF